MTFYALRYKPDTNLGRKFTQITLHTYDDQKTAERVRDMCANAASIEVVDVDADGRESSTHTGQTGTPSGRLAPQLNEPPAAYLEVRDQGLLTTNKESPDA